MGNPVQLFTTMLTFFTTQLGIIMVGIIFAGACIRAAMTHNAHPVFYAGGFGALAICAGYLSQTYLGGGGG